jgi:hypothetical protein
LETPETANNQGNANQNHTKIALHTSCNRHHKKYRHQHVLVRMWGKRKPGTLLVGKQAGATTLEKI